MNQKFAGHTATEVNRFREEALERLRAVKSVSCTAETFDQALLLLDQAYSVIDILADHARMYEQNERAALEHPRNAEYLAGIAGDLQTAQELRAEIYRLLYREGI